MAKAGAIPARVSPSMKSYLCLVTTRPGQVPHLRHIDCEHDDQVQAALGVVLAEWSSIHMIEVLDGDRLVLTLDADALRAQSAE